MNFKEWLEANNVTVRTVKLDTVYENLENILGKQFWICDYRLNENKDNKSIRSVTPKLVQVCSNEILPKGKKVYYSPIHFREIKNGKTLSTVIAPYDNTGYRSYPGVSVSIFNTERACRDCFEQQCIEAIHAYNTKLEQITKELEARMNEIHRLRVDHSNF